MDQTEAMQDAETLCAKGDFAGAAERYSSVLEHLVGIYGELSPETASCYLLYGTSLLQSYKASLKDSLFGPGVIQAASDALSTSSSQDSDPDSTANEGGSSHAEEDEEELQLAWESLEAARVIYMRTMNDPLLVKVYSALGDLETARENYGSATEEYRQALDCCDGQTPPRLVADLEYRLGVAYLAITGLEAHAIEHLERAADILGPRRPHA